MADRDRVAYRTAGAVGRAVLLAANCLELTGRQYRVLSAVIAFTALYSRTADRVYLAQVAAFAHGVDHAEPWQINRTREALAELEKLGLVARRPPRGRPPAGAEGPAYWIALRQPEKGPGPGPTSTPEKHLAPEVTFSPEKHLVPGAKSTSPPGVKAPRSWREKHLACGGPTEKVSEETPEESAEENLPGRERVKTNGVGSAGHRPAAVPPTGWKPANDTELRANAAVTGAAFRYERRDGLDGALQARYRRTLEPGDDQTEVLYRISEQLHRHLPEALLDQLEHEIVDAPPPTIADIVRRARELDHDLDVDLTLYEVVVGRYPVLADGPANREQVVVADHLEEHLDRRLLARLAQEVIDQPPKTVRLLLRRARQLADEAGVDLPRLDLPPATTRAPKEARP